MWILPTLALSFLVPEALAWGAAGTTLLLYLWAIATDR